MYLTINISEENFVRCIENVLQRIFENNHILQRAITYFENNESMRFTLGDGIPRTKHQILEMLYTARETGDLGPVSIFLHYVECVLRPNVMRSTFSASVLID